MVLFQCLRMSVLVSGLLSCFSLSLGPQLTAQSDLRGPNASKLSSVGYLGLHYDLHATANDTELGRETTYEHIREQLDKIKPDFVQYDCKGHGGFAGYPTKVGTASPGIQRDALRVWRQVTHDMGIPLLVHYSGIVDRHAIEVHPDWGLLLGPEGKEYQQSLSTCLLGPYRQKLMIPQLIEAISGYDLDGVWVDGECWAAHPCYCERCKAAFRQQTGHETIPLHPNEPHWTEWIDIQRRAFVHHVTEYADAVHASCPGALVCSNWMYSLRMPEPITAPVDFLSGDFDASFGIDRAASEGRFLASRGLPWNLMAWTFLSTGDQGLTYKTEPHLEQEASEVISQGGGVMFYDQPLRSGRLIEWHHDILGKVAKFCRSRQELCYRTESLPQVALLHCRGHYYLNCDPLYNYGDALKPLEGALDALIDAGYSADILNEEDLTKKIDSYPLVVIPEQEKVSEGFKAVVGKYVRGGGHVLLSGAMMAEDFRSLTQVVTTTASLETTRWLPTGNESVPVTGLWRFVRPSEVSRTVSRLLTTSEPDRDPAAFSASTISTIGAGKALTIHGPVFRAYRLAHYPGLRDFLSEQIKTLVPDNQLIRREGPAWVETVARRKGSRQLVHLINRGSDNPLSPTRHITEHISPTGPVTIKIPLPAMPRRCYMAPDEAELKTDWHDGVLTAEVDQIEIQNTLVIEAAGDK